MKELIKKIPFIRALVAKARKLIMKYFSEVGYVCKHINQLYGYVRNFKKISQSKKLASRVGSECVAQIEQLQKHGFCHVGLDDLSVEPAIPRALHDIASSFDKLSNAELKEMFPQKSKNYWMDLLTLPVAAQYKHLIKDFACNEKTLPVMRK